MTQKDLNRMMGQPHAVLDDGSSAAYGIYPLLLQEIAYEGTAYYGIPDDIFKQAGKANAAMYYIDIDGELPEAFSGVPIYTQNLETTDWEITDRFLSGVYYKRANRLFKFFVYTPVKDVYLQIATVHFGEPNNGFRIFAIL